MRRGGALLKARPAQGCLQPAQLTEYLFLGGLAEAQDAGGMNRQSVAATVNSSPATHAILTSLKAGESMFPIFL